MASCLDSSFPSSANQASQIHDHLSTSTHYGNRGSIYLSCGMLPRSLVLGTPACLRDALVITCKIESCKCNECKSHGTEHIKRSLKAERSSKAVSHVRMDVPPQLVSLLSLSYPLSIFKVLAT